jgi:hypothetical protein
LEAPDEPEALVGYYRKRHGLSDLHVDVSELRLKDGEVYYDDARVDLAYREAAEADREGAMGVSPGRVDSGQAVHVRDDSII